jgi:C_GCAxxG_C_C family probable redox protein
MRFVTCPQAAGAVFLPSPGNLRSIALISQQDAIHKARAYFLRDDNLYGCAETTFMILKEVYDLPDPLDSSAAMALGGGVAYSGGVCGAILGAALAVGMLAERRIPDHKEAKRAARRVIAGYMEQFQAAFHSTNCRDLIELDIRDEQQHQRFIESGIWRSRCMAQIEFAVLQLYDLRNEWKSS